MVTQSPGASPQAQTGADGGEGEVGPSQLCSACSPPGPAWAGLGQLPSATSGTTIISF